MTLPASGVMGAGMINVEMGNTANTTLGINSTNARYLANVFSGPIGYGSFYGKTQPLSPPPTPEFINSGFETGTTTGWVFQNSRFRFNSSGNTPTQIYGVAAPPDPTPNPYGSPGDIYGFSSGPGFASSVFSYSGAGIAAPPGGLIYGASTSNSGTQTGGYGIFYGPYIYSASPVIGNAGQTISFYWRATGIADAYCVRAYAFTNTGNYLILLDDTGSTPGASTPWTQSNTVIPVGQSGWYFFCFVCGSYDATGGTVIGAQLLIDEVSIT